MARARLFKPGFFTNARLSEVPAHGRLLFIGLWTLADKAGRLKDEPRVIKGATFPFENVPVDKLLAQLADLGFIERYAAGGENLIQIVNFEKHQHPHKNEAESVLLPPMSEVKPDNVNTKVSKGPALTIIESGESESGNGVGDGVGNESGNRALSALSGGFEYKLGPPFPDELGFVGEYVRHAEQLTGHHPGGSQVSDAAQLERDFGLEACRQVAEDTGWQKPPSWLRQKLVQRAKDAATKPAVIAAAARPKSKLYEVRE